MYICAKCEKEIKDGQYVIEVNDGRICSNNDMFPNELYFSDDATSYYHQECFNEMLK